MANRFKVGDVVRASVGKVGGDGYCSLEGVSYGEQGMELAAVDVKPYNASAHNDRWEDQNIMWMDLKTGKLYRTSSGDAIDDLDIIFTVDVVRKVVYEVERTIKMTAEVAK